MVSNLINPSLPHGSQKVWYLKLTDPVSQEAFWLNFRLLSSKNGFKKIAEILAIFFRKTSTGEVQKIPFKQSFDLGEWSQNDSTLHIHGCELSPNQTRGNLQSKGSSVEWDLKFLIPQTHSFYFIPEILSRTGLIRHSIVTEQEELLVSGSTRVNQETIHWHEAFGMTGHLFGSSMGHSWVWGHCNTFTNERGTHEKLIFEGLTGKPKLGLFSTPALSSFYFFYQNQPYLFNTLRDSVFLKSSHSLNEWKFQADRRDLSFRGLVRAEHKDFIGLTYENTDGSILYDSSSALSEMKVWVYRKGKLESTFLAHGSASFKNVSPIKNPYVPLLI